MSPVNRSDEAMSSARRSGDGVVRSEHSARGGAAGQTARSGQRTGRLTVAVTGASSATGAALCAALATRDDVGKVVAIDSRRGIATGVTWRVLDIGDPTQVQRIGKVDAVVHLDALELGAGAEPRGVVRGVQSVLTAAAALAVRRVVLVTSAMVYGALPDNPVPLDEDAVLRAVPDSRPLSDLLEIEELADRARGTHPGLVVTVVRPASVVGHGGSGVLGRYFEAPRLLVVRDTEPHWQFCHVDDLVSALVLAAVGAAEGALTIGAEGWLDQTEVERISGLRHIELPAAMAFGTADRLHRIGLLPAGSADLQYVVHPWVVPSTRLRAAGWRPSVDNATALSLLLEDAAGRTSTGTRRVGRRDAAVGAAAASVAVVGTAALVRRARKKRRG